MGIFLVVASLALSSPQRASGQFVLEEATIQTIHQAMRSGEITCVSLVNMYLARIDAYDKRGPEINAIITVNPRAVEVAREMDASRARSGLSGPLHCIPVIVKDNYDTVDMPTTGGSLAFEGVVPSEDAFAVKRLREAGALILAKANLDEFAKGSSGLSSLGGQTRNPYALDHIPGGSSAGTGAAIAANFATVGLGTETGVSIRNPSTNNNLVGIAPTRGLVSRYGVMPISFTQDRAGPLARTVADAAIVLDAIAGYDPRDIYSEERTESVPASYAESLRADGLRGARIGVVRELFGPNETETSRLVNAAVEQLKKQGALVVDPVSLEPLFEHMFPVLDPAYQRLNPGKEIEFATVLSDARMNAYEFRTAFNEYLSRPGYEAPIGSLQDLIASGKHLPRLGSGLLSENEFVSLDQEEYLERLLRHRALHDFVVKVMADQNLDALVYPMKRDPAPRIREPGGADGGHIVSSITGLPAIVVPAGFTAAGLPVSIEFVGRPFSESTLIELAYSYEQATKHRRPPASVPALPRKP